MVVSSFERMSLDGAHSPVFQNGTLNNFLIGVFWPKWFLIFLMFQNNFLCINSGLKYSFGGSLNKIGQVAFALVLGPHNNNIVLIQTYIILKPLFWAQGSFKQIFPLKTQNQISLQPLYFLYSLIGKTVK